MATTARSLLSRLWLALNPSPAAEVDKSSRIVAEIDRHQRYAILEAFARQTAYHGSYAERIRVDFGAYRHVRPIFGRCKRILDVHRSLTMGGVLDAGAGDGKETPTCLPILVGDKADADIVRAAIASLWQASNWAQKKTVFTGITATCGDGLLEVVPDEKRGLVRLRVGHPSEVVDAVRDDYGNVQEIVLEQTVPDPEDRSGKATAVYRREMVNDDGKVTVRTFRDGSLYPWSETLGTEYILGTSSGQAFPFVPIVLVKHIDDGGEWGEAEHNAALFKTVARDSAGSALDDQVLKAIKGMWFLSGAMIGKEKVKLEDLTEERDDILILTCNSKDGSIQALVFPLPIAEASDHGRSIDRCLEDDYPELRINPVGADASGESRREARREVEAKIIERRAAYDAGLMAAHKMAMTIGGMSGFEAYKGFNKDSFRLGMTDHRIGPRPVFGVDPLDVLAERLAEAKAIKEYVDGGAGVPLPTALERVGWPADKIAEVKALLAEEGVQVDQFRDDLPGLAIAQ